jgi:hypothetical protein
MNLATVGFLHYDITKAKKGRRCQHVRYRYPPILGFDWKSKEPNLGKKDKRYLVPDPELPVAGMLMKKSLLLLTHEHCTAQWM